MTSRALLFFLFMMAGVVSAADEGSELMTAQDVSHHALSNITLINRTQLPVTVYGLYIASFDINDCSACFGSIVSGNNVQGAFVGPVAFQVNQRVAVGQNYLYNMIYSGLYSVQQTVGSSPCLLPGCTWPGDDPSVRGWCLTIGAMSLNSNYTFSSYTQGNNPPANVVPFSEAVTSNPFHYRYDLIDPNLMAAGAACLGPIACNDKSLTCSVSTPQSESFQPY